MERERDGGRRVRDEEERGSSAHREGRVDRWRLRRA